MNSHSSENLPQEQSNISDKTIIIDNRTPEEYAQGHLMGAQLLDYLGGDLSRALPTLDPQAEYLVYCRSGNRSGKALKLMQEAGIQRVTNLGGLEAAAQKTGRPIVQD